MKYNFIKFIVLFNKLASLSFVLLFSKILLANGFVNGTDIKKHGDILIDGNAEFSLISENLNIKLLQDNYIAKVTYKIKSKNKKPTGRLYFPFLCASNEISKCIHFAKVKLNGKDLNVEYSLNSNINKWLRKKYKYILRKNLAKHGVKTELEYFKGKEYYGYDDELAESFNFFVVESKFNFDKENFNLEITYKSDYVYTYGGYSGNVIHEYSEDVIYYDFSPASLWSKNKLESLDITIDATDAGVKLNNHGPLKLTSDVKNNTMLTKLKNSIVNFINGHKNNRAYMASYKNIHARDVEPLIVGIKKMNINFINNLLRHLIAGQKDQKVSLSLIKSH